MPTITLFYIFITALLASLVLIPPVSRLAFKVGGMDRPDSRKVHSAATPRLGGIAIFFAFLVPLLLYCDLSQRLSGILAGALIAFLVGLADDLFDIAPRQKLAGQMLAATAVVTLGEVRLTSLGDPLGLGGIELGMLSVPFSIFAIVGVMNAINLIDGLDGLAGGISSIACVVLGAICWKTGNLALLCVITSLLGATVGFLNYNTYPARIFLGDSGSLLLGYLMGVCSILLVSGGDGRVSPCVPLIVLAVPILDTIVVMVNRLRKGSKLFSADKSHIHHRLLDLGLGHKGTVIVAYGLTYALSSFAVLGHGLRDHHLAAGLALIFCVGYSSLNLISKHRLHRYLRLPRNNESLRRSAAYRRMVTLSRALLVPAKGLLLLTLALSCCLPASAGHGGVGAAGLVTLLLLIFGSQRSNRLMQLVLYLGSAFMIFQMENLARGTSLLGLPALAISDYLFLLLCAGLGVGIFVQGRGRMQTNSPVEYLIVFITLSLPLLPHDLTRELHLLTVAGKSLIFFFAAQLAFSSEAQPEPAVAAPALPRPLATVHTLRPVQSPLPLGGLVPATVPVSAALSPEMQNAGPNTRDRPWLVGAAAEKIPAML